MTRWRVKCSRRTPTWFHAVEVSFVDAEDASSAKALLEADPQLEAWDVSQATPQMEALHDAWMARTAAWRLAAQTATAQRGML